MQSAEEAYRHSSLTGTLTLIAAEITVSIRRMAIVTVSTVLWVIPVSATVLILTEAAMMIK